MLAGVFCFWNVCTKLLKLEQQVTVKGALLSFLCLLLQSEGI